MKPNKLFWGHFAALLTVIFWGTTFVSTKQLLLSFTPVEILIMRFVLGFVALNLFYPHRLRGTTHRQELYFAAAGLCGITLYFLLENIALIYTMASNVGVIVAVAPLFIALFSRVFLHSDPLPAAFYVGFVAAIAGISLISFGGSRITVSPLGDALAFGAAVVWAIYSLLVRKISTFGFHTVQTTRRVFLYGLLLMIPVVLVYPVSFSLEAMLVPINLANLLYLGLGASAVCFVTWNLAVKALGAVKTSVYIYAVPVVTVICSGIFLGEKITATALVGTMLTLVGLFLSEGKVSLNRKQGAHRG